MPRTAKRTIDLSATNIGIKQSGIELSNDEYLDHLDALNSMMRQYSASGLQTGYSVVSELSDDIGVPDWAYDFVMYALCIRLSTYYDAPIPQGIGPLLDQAQRIVELKQYRPFANFQDTLPKGTGESRYDYDKYFKDPSCGELSDSNDSTITDGRGRGLRDNSSSAYNYDSFYKNQ